VDWSTFLAGKDLPAVMGIVNVTPDSFSDGGRYFSTAAAVDHALRLADEGADLIDIGGESTRPPVYGEAEPVDAAEEIRRVVPVLDALAGKTTVPLSIDTRKSEVARAALAAGASIVNDVTALRYDPAVARAAADAGAGVILMHMRGTDPRRMQDDVAYGDPIGEIADALSAAAGAARAAGIAATGIAIDPGLGFGKSPAHNLILVARLSAFARLGWPVVVGASRKGFVARFSGHSPGAAPPDRLAGSLACVATVREQGGAVVRVHEVAATVRFLRALARGAAGPEAAAEAGASPEAYATMASALRGAAGEPLQSPA